MSSPLPDAARQRLEEVRRRDGAFFTSDLSVPEFLLVREGGFKPLTQVMGSCFYHVGWQTPGAGMGYGPGMSPFFGGMASGSGQTFELETLTEAWNEARRLALERLAEEARLAGADAVVGVRIERGAYDWAAGLIEFVAVGTAVRSERYDLGGQPVLSNLSGQEFAKLFRHGWWPAGIVAGTTVCYVVTGWGQQSRLSYGGAWQNQELPDFTRGLYDARAQAMRRVERQGRELDADGVVGVLLDRHEQQLDQGGIVNLLVTMHVMGTAVNEVTPPGEPDPVYFALPLNEERRR